MPEAQSTGLQDNFVLQAGQNSMTVIRKTHYLTWLAEKACLSRADAFSAIEEHSCHHHWRRIRW
jgi:hypothetical protein